MYERLSKQMDNVCSSENNFRGLSILSRHINLLVFVSSVFSVPYVKVVLSTNSTKHLTIIYK